MAFDESFCPLAAVFTFSTEQDGVQVANNTKFGLAGYFFSMDISHVVMVAQCSMVWVNTGLINATRAPF